MNPLWRKDGVGREVLTGPTGRMYPLTQTRYEHPTVERVDYWLGWIATRPDRAALAADTDALLDARAVIQLEQQIGDVA